LQLADCVMDMQGLMAVVSERVRGEHPSIQHVLGLRGAPKKVIVRTNDATSQLENIAAMRSELAAIRDAMSEQYAADIGRDSCGMQ
jgi:hypothetical protein